MKIKTDIGPNKLKVRPTLKKAIIQERKISSVYEASLSFS